METRATGDTGIMLRSLTDKQSDLDALQRVLDAVPRYARAVNGAPFGPDEAQRTSTELPEGKTLADKFVFAIHHDGEMIGCVDLIRGYPVPSIALLGLLVIVEGSQGKGLGAEAYRHVEDEVRSWGVCDRIRIGVVASNEPAFPFWSARGFVPTGEVKPYTCGSLSSEIVVLEKPLS